MSEKQEKVSVSVRMPAELYEALKILALAEERSLSKQIIHAINEWMQAGKDEDNNSVVDISSGDATISSDGFDKLLDGWTAEITGQTGKVVTGTVISYSGEINNTGYGTHEISFVLHEPINFTSASLLQSQIKFIPRKQKKTRSANQITFGASPSYSLSPSASPSPSESPGEE